MNGLPLLLKLRQDGYLPPSAVTVTIGGKYRTPVYASEFQNLELTMDEGKNPGLLDLRPFIGLDVIVTAPALTGQVRELFHGIRLYARSVSVLCVDLGDKIGFMWDRENGTRAF